MQGVTSEIKLDMTAGALPVVRAKQHDTNSRWVRITLMDKGAPWVIPFDAEVYVYIKKPDGTVVFDYCTLESQNTVLYLLTGQPLAAAGQADCELYIVAGGFDIRPQLFRLVVDPTIYDENAIVSTSEFGALQSRLMEIQAAMAEARSVTADMQDTIAAAQAGINYTYEAAGAATKAADSLQVAVDAAEQAQISQAAAEAVRAYVEKEKDSFTGYSKRETDTAYANAITGTASGTGSVSVPDAWGVPVKDIAVGGKSVQGIPAPDYPQEIRSVGGGGMMEIVSAGGTESLPGLSRARVPAVLRGIDDVRDRLGCRDGVWGIERNLTSMRGLKWSEPGTPLGTEYKDSFFAVAELWGMPINNYTNLLSSVFAEVTSDRILDENVNGCYVYDGTIRARIVGISTYDQFYEAINDAEFVIPLTTPTWEPLPDYIQTQLNSLTMYRGDTSCVYVTGSDVVPDMTVEYVRDTNRVVEQLQLDMAEREINILAVIGQLKTANNLL